MYKEEWLYAWFWTGTSVEEVETPDSDKLDNAQPTEYMSVKIASELIKYESKRFILKFSLFMNKCCIRRNVSIEERLL